MSNFTHLIDFEGTFAEAPEKWMRQEGLTDCAFDYSVITVLGCQSSGKSTLLNALFGTRFPVMDAAAGRQQTTKGIWLGRDKSSHTLVMDVEGTDSRERGEDRLTFEHRAALFSLALADCVIVNMWYHDIGRYTASNYGLLKTVLGVNLELFQKQAETPKTTMIFVIRDYNQALTPLGKLQEMIEADIRQLWDETTKPEEFKHRKADEFFYFKTVGLPSRVDHQAAFDAACKNLRETWLNEWRPKQYSRQVPADGFSFYCKSVWDTILESSELDIPSQKEMLATYRCEELKNAALVEVAPYFPKILAQAEKGNLNTSDPNWALQPVVSAMEIYDVSASRYQNSVYKKKRDQLLVSLQQELQKAVSAQLVHTRHRVAHDAAERLRHLFPPQSAATSNILEHTETPETVNSWASFKETGDRWIEEAVTAFDAVAAGMVHVKLPENIVGAKKGEDRVTALCFDVSPARITLTEALESMLQSVREKQQQRFYALLHSAASNTLADFTSLFLDPELSTQTFWKSIAERYRVTCEQLESKFRAPFMGLLGEPEAGNAEEEWKKCVTRTGLKQTHLKLCRVVEWLPNSILDRFRHFFDQDAQGVPRQWQSMSNDKIKDTYLKAREKGLVVLDVFRNSEDELMKLAVHATDKETVKTLCTQFPVIAEGQEHVILAKAQKRMQKACQEAQLLQATGGKGTHVPWWMWGLLLALGYNEIAMVIFSPFTLITCLIVLIVLSIAYYTGNAKLPVKLSRQVVGIVASALIPLLTTLQQPTCFQDIPTTGHSNINGTMKVQEPVKTEETKPTEQ